MLLIPYTYSLVFGKAEILNLAAPIGIKVISSFAPFAASSSGNTPQIPVSSIFQLGIWRPNAFTSKGTLPTVNGKLSAGHSLRTTLKFFNGSFWSNTNE